MTTNRGAIKRLSRATTLLFTTATLLMACTADEQPQPFERRADLREPREVTITPVTADGDSFAGNYLAGHFAMDQGDLIEAGELFEDALNRTPDNAELRERVVMLNLAAGEVERALEFVTDDAAEMSDNVALLRAVAAIGQNANAVALERFRGLSDNGVIGLIKPFLVTWSRVASQGAEAVERIAPSDTDALRLLRGYHEAVLQSLRGDYAAAEQALEALIEPDGRTPVQIVRTLAHVLAEQDRVEAAREFLQEENGRVSSDAIDAVLSQLDDEGSVDLPFATPRTAIADALFGVAEALGTERGGTQSLLYAQMAHHLDPSRGEIAILIGDIFSVQENPRYAAEAYGRVPAESPYRWFADLRRAVALEDAEDLDGAKRLLASLAETRGEGIEPLVALGDIHRRQEDYSGAASAYSRAIDRLDEASDNDWSLFYKRGIAFERTKQWPRAEADFLKALELEPDQPLVLNYLGYSWVDQGLNLDRAQDMIRSAVDQRPQDGFIVDSLGWVYYKLGKFDQAVELLERAVELQPGDPVINDHLGDAYWQVARQREARFQWRRALSLEPETEEIAKINRKIQVGLQQSAARDD